MSILRVCALVHVLKFVTCNPDSSNATALCHVPIGIQHIFLYCISSIESETLLLYSFEHDRHIRHEVESAGNHIQRRRVNCKHSRALS